MKYYIIAGEASGDLHASNLMKELKEKDPKADFRFWGGDLMQAEGGTCVKHYKETAFMGFVGVLVNIRKVFKNLSFCKSDISKYNPDAVIFVDYPGFNLRIAEYTHQKGYKNFYYISPKIWAWKESRVEKIKKYIDKLFVIFPFEIDFYKKHNYKVEFVGNPLLDAIEEKINNKISRKKFLEDNNLQDKPIVAILAGSRKQEISSNLPLMVKVSKYFPDYQFVLAAAPSLDLKIYDKYIKNTNIKIVYNKTYDVMQHSVAGLITSGTATLEAALFNLPELVCYKGDWLSYQILKRLIKVKYASLVNLIMDRLLIKEFLQYDMTVENVKNELNKLLHDNNHISQMKNNFAEMREVLGGKGASERTAEIIVSSVYQSI